MIIKSEKLKVSASAIKTYTQCPRKYYYTYINKLPKKKWAHIELGNFVHDALETFHNRMRDDPLPESGWAQALKEACFAEAPKYALTKEQRATAFGMLQTYLQKLKENGFPKVLFNEKEFTIELPGNVVLRGFIDRVDKPDDIFEIVDYKTGKSKHLDEFQLLVYALALWHEHPEIKRVKGSYIVLGEGSKVIPYTISKTDTDRCVTEILKVADMIRTDQSWEPRPTRLCSYCDFESACPATKSDTNEWGSAPGASNG